MNPRPEAQSRLFSLQRPRPRRAEPPRGPADSLLLELQRDCALRHGVRRKSGE